MDAQLFQILLGVAAGAISFIAARIWAILADLQKRDQHLTEKMQDIQLMLTDRLSNYVKRDEMLQVNKVIFQKLDKIEDTLHSK